MSHADMHDLYFELAHEDREFALENQRRPSQAGHRFHASEQTRETIDFGFHVLLATLNDQLIGAARSDHLLRALFEISGGTQHAHRVVVREGDVFDRQISDFAYVFDQRLRHHWRGGGVDHHHGIVADDHTRIRITFGGIGIGIVRELDETGFLFLQISLRCKRFGAHEVSVDSFRPDVGLAKGCLVWE